MQLWHHSRSIAMQTILRRLLLFVVAEALKLKLMQVTHCSLAAHSGTMTSCRSSHANKQPWIYFRAYMSNDSTFAEHTNTRRHGLASKRARYDLWQGQHLRYGEPPFFLHEFALSCLFATCRSLCCYDLLQCRSSILL